MSSNKQIQGNNQKQWVFYDTSFTRNNILALNKLENNKKEFRKYIEDYILNYWDKTDASADRNEVFLDFLCHLWRFMDAEYFSAEQKSTLFSLSYYIFRNSLEKKQTQIESYQLLQEALNSQTLVTNNQYLPIFKLNQTQKVDKFFKDYFYKYYSLYEITMTKYIDLNIFTTNKHQMYNFPQLKSLDEHQKADAQNIAVLEEYMFAEQNEDDMEENDEENQDDQQEEVASHDNEYDNEDNYKRDFLNNLNLEDQKILTHVNDKISNFNSTLEQKQQELQNQLDENVEKIINPPKKK